MDIQIEAFGTSDRSFQHLYHIYNMTFREPRVLRSVKKWDWTSSHSCYHPRKRTYPLKLDGWKLKIPFEMVPSQETFVHLLGGSTYASLRAFVTS